MEGRKNHKTNTKMPCIFCRSEQSLTDEHLFPAFCGGVLIVPNASCVACNRDKCSKFENMIAQNTRTLRNILEIADRYGEVPSSKVIFELENLKIPARRTANGEIILQDFVGELPLKDGKKHRRGFFINPKPAQKFFNKERQRGEKVEDIPVQKKRSHYYACFTTDNTVRFYAGGVSACREDCFGRNGVQIRQQLCITVTF